MHTEETSFKKSLCLNSFCGVSSVKDSGILSNLKIFLNVLRTSRRSAFLRILSYSTPPMHVVRQTCHMVLVLFRLHLIMITVYPANVLRLHPTFARSMSKKLM